MAKKKLVWTTVKRKINDLIPFDKNPRILTEEKKEKLKASLEKFGLAEIPAITTDNVILAGHQRMKVMQLLGYGSDIIDVRIPNRKLTKKEVKEYNITSNVQAGEWNIDMLENYFSDIDLAEIGLELDELSFNKNVDLTDEELDEVPEEPKIPISAVGDLYELNGHRVLCGDSRKVSDVKKLMNGKVCDMVFQDPPYNVKIDDVVNNTNQSKSKKKRHTDFVMASGEMTPEEFTQFLTVCFKNNVQFSKKGSIHYNFMDWKHIDEILKSIKSVFKGLKQLIVWNKDNAGMGTFYRSKHELIFVTKHGNEKHTNNFGLGETGRYRTNVWNYPSAISFQNRERIENKTKGAGDLEFHPTVKPVRLVADAIIDCSNRGEIIQDLFIGSGTTLISSDTTDRICYGMELDPKYCDVILKRWLIYMRRSGQKVTVKRNGKQLKPEQLRKIKE